MSGERILVVDDSKENREFVLNAVLKPNGFEALQARDGLEGLEMARKLSPDLMLLDLQMPRMNGIQVLEALRNENLNIPVVLMTFHGSEDIAVEVFRLGVRDYVKKPYTADEMLAAIDASLTEARLRREKETLTNRLMSSNRELHNRVRELNMLYNVGKSVTSLTEPSELMRRIVEAATLLTNSEQGSLWLIEDDRLTLRAVRRRGEPHAQPVSEPSDDRLAHYAIEKNTTVMPTNEELTHWRERDPSLPAALLIVPLHIGDRTLGALGTARVIGSFPFGQHDGALLSTLSDYAAIALENAHNFAALKEGTAQGSPISTKAQPPDRRQIGALAADLREFNLVTRVMNPKAAAEVLSQYLALADSSMRAQGGIVNVFDLVTGVFDGGNEALRAVDSAVAIRAAVGDLNAHYGADLHFSFGIALGESFTGSVGAPAGYAAVGETVSIARRLQEFAEPGQILIEQEALAQVANLVDAVQVAELKVMEDGEPIAVYQIHQRHT